MARILTTVGAGVPLLCCGCQLGGGFLIGLLFLGSFGSGLEDSGDPLSEGEYAEDPLFGEDADRFYAELDRISMDTAWLEVTGAIMALLCLAAVLVLITLLFVPPSNRYFRPGAGQPAVRYLPYPVYLPVPVAYPGQWPVPPPAYPAPPTAQPQVPDDQPSAAPDC